MPTVGRRVNYEKYLQSTLWFNKRNESKARANYRCQLCNSPERLEVHHRTYERLGNELPEDLTVLCNDCHKAHSRRQQRLKNKGKIRSKGKRDEISAIDKEIARTSYRLKRCRWSEVERLKKYFDDLKEKKKDLEGKR